MQLHLHLDLFDNHRLIINHGSSLMPMLKSMADAIHLRKAKSYMRFNLSETVGICLNSEFRHKADSCARPIRPFNVTSGDAVKRGDTASVVMSSGVDALAHAIASNGRSRPA